MKQNIRLVCHPNSLWSRLLDSNPQLFREIQGKLKTRNVVIAAAVSVITQFMTVILFLGQLPDLRETGNQCGRYGMALVYAENQYQYNSDYGRTCYALNDAGAWVINWQLWWLDLFITLSIISLIALLVVGTYMLIADMVKEEERGTLNFIRLTPQSANSILFGKILGVPILLYTAIAFLFPLHLASGLQSHIPLNLILAFDLIVIASCGLVYCLALLWSLVDLGEVVGLSLSGFKSWLAAGSLSFMLLVSTAILFDGYIDLDYFLASLIIFHPGTVLSYLINAAQLHHGEAIFLSLDNLSKLSFYGKTFWGGTTVGMSLIFLNFSLWTYWCWSILKRRFHNPTGTILSKVHSYWLTGWFVLVALGFTLQQDFPSYMGKSSTSNIPHITDNFFFLQICLSLFGLGLIFALSPHRQDLYDWARYRHQTGSKNSLWQELILGEKSPAIIAVALNFAIAITFIAPSIFLVMPPSHRYLFWGFVLSGTNILLYGVIVQFILTSKTRKRGIFSLMIVSSMIILPPLCFRVALKAFPSAFLFSFAPITATGYATPNKIAFAIFGQWLGIMLISLQMTRKLKHAGASESKILMSRVKTLKD